jgi:membrane protease YdiL (CAAX protease family)
LKKDSSQWRRGFVGQFLRAFFSFVVMGLLGFKEEFGLTLQNVNESLWLLLSLGLPFAILFACGAFILMRKGQSGKLPMPSADWMKNPSERIGHIIYCFTMNGVGEEMFYRGLIQGYLSVNMVGFILVGSFPLMYSTVLASVLFILIHLENVRTKDESMAEYLFMLPYRTIITFILGITFQLTGSLFAPIIIHNVSNGFLSIVAIQATRN